MERFKNQCDICDAYRIDGEPPYIHHIWCPNQPSIEESVDRFLKERREMNEKGVVYNNVLITVVLLLAAVALVVFIVASLDVNVK